MTRNNLSILQQEEQKEPPLDKRMFECNSKLNVAMLIYSCSQIDTCIVASYQQAAQFYHVTLSLPLLKGSGQENTMKKELMFLAFLIASKGN